MLKKQLYLFKWKESLLVDAFQTLSDVVIRGDSPLSTPTKHAFEKEFIAVSHFEITNNAHFTCPRSVVVPRILGFSFLFKTIALQNMTHGMSVTVDWDKARSLYETTFLTV